MIKITPQLLLTFNRQLQLELSGWEPYDFLFFFIYYKKLHS